MSNLDQGAYSLSRIRKVNDEEGKVYVVSDGSDNAPKERNV